MNPVYLSWAAVVVPLIVVIMQYFTKKKVNEIHVMVNSEHDELVAQLKMAHEKIDRLINALPERTIKTRTGDTRQ